MWCPVVSRVGQCPRTELLRDLCRSRLQCSRGVWLLGLGASLGGACGFYFPRAHASSRLPCPLPCVSQAGPVCWAECAVGWGAGHPAAAAGGSPSKKGGAGHPSLLGAGWKRSAWGGERPCSCGRLCSGPRWGFWHLPEPRGPASPELTRSVPAHLPGPAQAGSGILLSKAP